jgi:hypothetical protein
MKLTDFYNEVSRRTDTRGTKINVAETKRCISEAFNLLAELPSEEAFALVASGLKRNKEKKGKKGKK